MNVANRRSLNSRLTCLGGLLQPAVLALALAFPGVTLTAKAHPMPHSEIEVSLGNAGAVFDIAVPIPELLLAEPTLFPSGVEQLTEQQMSSVTGYFEDHLSVIGRNGALVPLEFETVNIIQSSDESVGKYQELLLRIRIPSNARFDPGDFTLHYDAVIHRIPNHFATVKMARTVHRKPNEGIPEPILGVIRFDFVNNRTSPIEIR